MAMSRPLCEYHISERDFPAHSLAVKKTELHERVKKAILSKYENLNQFALEFPKDYSTVHKWSTGVQRPGRESLARIAEMTGVSMDELTGNALAESVTVYDTVEHPAFTQFVAEGWPDRLRLDARDLATLRGIDYRDGLTVANLVSIGSNLAVLHDAPEHALAVAARAKNDADGVKRKIWKPKK